MAKKEPRLVETAIPGHFTYELPPEGFEPIRASDDQLAQYGLPHRPDPRKLPQAARLWIRSMRRVRKFVTPELAVIPKIVHGPPPVIEDGVSTSDIWSGLRVDWGNSMWSSVWGNWIIPAVSIPDGVSGDFLSSIWVGLLGSSLLQAGTEQDVSSGTFGGSSYYAWYEWFPASPVQIGGFPVGPGQAITVMVGVLDPASFPNNQPGVVSMLNVATGVAITPIVVPIPTQDFNGNSISPPIQTVPSHHPVWILERPSLPINGNPVPQALSDYGEAVMNGGASIKSSDVGVGDNAVTVGVDDAGTLLNMVVDVPFFGNFEYSTATEDPELQFNYAGISPFPAS